jgi:isochorismate pyruvate lyase
MAMGISSVWREGFHVAVVWTSGNGYCPAMSQQPPPRLATLRQRIDAIDRDLLVALGKRQALVNQVIAVKQREGLPARIPERVVEVVAHVTREAPKHGTSPDLAKAVWTAMIDWFIAHEDQQLKKDG